SLVCDRFVWMRAAFTRLHHYDFASLGNSQTSKTDSILVAKKWYLGKIAIAMHSIDCIKNSPCGTCHLRRFGLDLDCSAYRDCGWSRNRRQLGFRRRWFGYLHRKCRWCLRRRFHSQPALKRVCVPSHAESLHLIPLRGLRSGNPRLTWLESFKTLRPRGEVLSPSSRARQWRCSTPLDSRRPSDRNLGPVRCPPCRRLLFDLSETGGGKADHVADRKSSTPRPVIFQDLAPGGTSNSIVEPPADPSGYARVHFGREQGSGPRELVGRRQRLGVGMRRTHRGLPAFDRGLSQGCQGGTMDVNARPQFPFLRLEDVRRYRPPEVSTPRLGRTRHVRRSDTSVDLKAWTDDIGHYVATRRIVAVNEAGSTGVYSVTIGGLWVASTVTAGPLAVRSL